MSVVDDLLVAQPAFHSGGRSRWYALPETLHLIEQSFTASNRTLEIGCGVSTVVFASLGCQHTCISPDAEEHARVSEYCASQGIDTSKVDFIAGYSDRILPGMLEAGPLDGAFIDGAHRFPHPVIDMHYIAARLVNGGLMILDDIPVPAVAVVYRYLMSEPNWELVRFTDERAAALRKTGEPEPGDTWITQPFNRHFPDYSFAPLGAHLRLAATDRYRRARRTVGRRFPGLADRLRRSR